MGGLLALLLCHILNIIGLFLSDGSLLLCLTLLLFLLVGKSFLLIDALLRFLCGRFLRLFGLNCIALTAAAHFVHNALELFVFELLLLLLAQNFHWGFLDFLFGLVSLGRLLLRLFF